MLSHYRIRVNAGLERMPGACRYFQECKQKKGFADVCMHAYLFQVFLYVHIFVCSDMWIGARV